MNEIKLIEKDGKHLCPRYDGRVHIGTSPPECAHDACDTLCACHYRVRVPELEAALADAQAEVERLREVELMLRAGQLHYKKRGDARVELIQELGARAESAEAALEEANETIEGLKRAAVEMNAETLVSRDKWRGIAEEMAGEIAAGRENMETDRDILREYDAPEGGEK